MGQIIGGSAVRDVSAAHLELTDKKDFNPPHSIPSPFQWRKPVPITIGSAKQSEADEASL